MISTDDTVTPLYSACQREALSLWRRNRLRIGNVHICYFHKHVKIIYDHTVDIGRTTYPLPSYSVFTALHVMQTRYCDENSVRLSVCLSVRLSHA